MPSPPPLDGFDFSAIWRRAQTVLIDGAFDVVAAILLVIVGIYVASALSGAIRRVMLRTKRVDATIAAFFASLARYGVYAVIVIAVLQQFGVQTASIVAVLGAATLAIGLALQGTLSNVAAGVMLVMFRPYRLGDFVQIGDRQGVVKDITLFTTELATLDNVKVLLPNGLCWGAPISNFSHHPTRMVELTFAVGRFEPLDRALAIVAETLQRHPKVLKDPAPFVAVDAIRDYSIAIIVRAWCANADWAAVRYSLVQQVKEAFDRAGVEMPLPSSVTYPAHPTREP